MALATLENVIATVGAGAHNVSLTIEEDGLIVGSFGKMPWAGAEISTEVGNDGFMINMACGPEVLTQYFVPSTSFASFGGARAMKSFAVFLVRSAVAAGARSTKAA